jgi:NitT/TauT family transport system permease protein
MATMTTADDKRRPAISFAVGPRLTTAGWNVFAVAVALALWQVAAVLIGSPYFPGPIKVADAFIRLAAHGDISGVSLWAHAWASIERVLVGFGLGVLGGVPLGLLMGLCPSVYARTRAVLEPFRFIPPIAWIPLAIIFFSGLATMPPSGLPT